tara:strand:+ start:140 stop:787 length:648 start_codon:yes stop_codon:yes gene_type:complete
MKIKKGDLRRIIREELTRVNELFGFGGSDKKEKTVTVTTGMNFPPGYRFMNGIELEYDKSKDVFTATAGVSKGKEFRNSPGHSEATNGDTFQGHKRDDEGIIYALAFKKHFKKDAPAPKGSSIGGPTPEPGANVLPDSDNPIAAELARLLIMAPNRFKINKDMVGIMFSKQKSFNRSKYAHRKDDAIKALEGLGYEVEDQNRHIDEYWQFKITKK